MNPVIILKPLYDSIRCTIQMYHIFHDTLLNLLLSYSVPVFLLTLAGDQELNRMSGLYMCSLYRN